LSVGREAGFVVGVPEAHDLPAMTVVRGGAGSNTCNPRDETASSAREEAGLLAETDSGIEHRGNHGTDGQFREPCRGWFASIREREGRSDRGEVALSSDRLRDPSLRKD
jgi:hypothetical protein